MEGGEVLKLKKCGFLFSLVMVVCFAIPSFAKAEVVDYLKGKIGLEYSTNQRITELTDGNITTYYWFSSGQYFVYYMPTVLKDATQLKILADDISVIEVEFFNGSNRVLTYYGKEFNFDGKYYVKDVSKAGMKDKEFNQFRIKSSGKNLKVYDLQLLNGIVEKPLDDIKNLNAISEADKVKFTWENPNDSNFTGVKVYFEGEERFSLKPNVTEVISKNLEPDKSYKYKFVAMYGDRASKGVEKTIQTKPKPKEPMPLVKPPENVFLTPQNGKMVIAWDDVKSPYLEGYNVYVDGKKINDKPLKSSELIVKSLENGKSYKVQISAVNKENAEGEKSKVKEEKPSSDALEVEYDVKVPFDAKEAVTVAMVFLMIVAPFILLGFALKLYKPFITFLYNSIQNKKRRE